MIWFTSQRERRLWLCVLAVIVAIFATLGLARTLAQLLAGTGLGEILFAGACLLVLTVVVTRGWTSRPRTIEIVVAIGVATAYLLVLVRMAVPTERSHLIEYGILALLIDEALLERRRNGTRVPFPGAFAIMVAALIGVIDEAIQAVWPGRFCDPVDMLFNTLAAVMAVASIRLLAWARGT
ncbi:MAG: VanZ family protein [Planctomycetota bacterium]